MNKLGFVVGPTAVLKDWSGFTQPLWIVFKSKVTARQEAHVEMMKMYTLPAIFETKVSAA